MTYRLYREQDGLEEEEHTSLSGIRLSCTDDSVVMGWAGRRVEQMLLSGSSQTV